FRIRDDAVTIRPAPLRPISKRKNREGKESEQGSRGFHGVKSNRRIPGRRQAARAEVQNADGWNDGAPIEVRGCLEKSGSGKLWILRVASLPNSSRNAPSAMRQTRVSDQFPRLICV